MVPGCRSHWRQPLHPPTCTVQAQQGHLAIWVTALPDRMTQRSGTEMSPNRLMQNTGPRSRRGSIRRLCIPEEQWRTRVCRLCSCGLRRALCPVG